MAIVVSGAHELGPGSARDEGPVTEDRIVLVAARADRDAEFTAFAAAAGPALGRMAWLLTGDAHAAAELVQTALVRTYVAWPRARETDPLGYARRVLANARVDRWRRLRREVLVEPAALPERGDLSQVGVVDERDRLVRALATLTARQRRIVVLRYWVGLSEREVAEDLGVSVGTVKTQASRSLRRLRAELDPRAFPTSHDDKERSDG